MHDTHQADIESTVKLNLPPAGASCCQTDATVAFRALPLRRRIEERRLAAHWLSGGPVAHSWHCGCPQGDRGAAAGGALLAGAAEPHDAAGEEGRRRSRHHWCASTTFCVSQRFCSAQQAAKPSPRQVCGRCPRGCHPFQTQGTYWTTSHMSLQVCGSCQRCFRDCRTRW